MVINRPHVVFILHRLLHILAEITFVIISIEELMPAKGFWVKYCSTAIPYQI